MSLYFGHTPSEAEKNITYTFQYKGTRVKPIQQKKAAKNTLYETSMLTLSTQQTDENIMTCEFHPAERLIKEDKYNQMVVSNL